MEAIYFTISAIGDFWIAGFAGPIKLAEPVGVADEPPPGD